MARSGLAPLLNYPRLDQTTTLSRDAATALSQLSILCSSDSLLQQERDLFGRALQGLSNLFRTIGAKPSTDVGHRMGWVVGPDASMLADLIQKRHPESLVTLSYWAASLGTWPNAWWEQNLGRELFREIQAELPPSYHACLAWPIRQYSSALSELSSGSER